MKWHEIQHDHSVILNSGINKLQNQKLEQVTHTEGNYLLSSNGVHLYIGESKNIPKRLNQHRLKNSAFSKNFSTYTAEQASLNVEYHTMQTRIGRKEIEEYGMYKLKPLFNKRHDKRKFINRDQKFFYEWEEIQQSSGTLLTHGREELLATSKYPLHSSVYENTPGVYCIWKEGEIIYIGESISIKERLKTHSNRTRFSVLRRTVAKQVFDLSLKTKLEMGNTISKDKKKMFLSAEEEQLIDTYLDEIEVSYLPTFFGRLELEEYLINLIRPKFNKKSIIK